MKHIIAALILLLFCGCEQTYSYTNPYILGGLSSACPYEPITDHYWIMDPTDADDDYLMRNNIDALEADTYTVVGMWLQALSGSINEYVGAQYENTQRSWSISVTAANLAIAASAANSCSSSDTKNVAFAGGGINVKVLVAQTFQYSGNPGSTDSTQIIYYIDGSGTDVGTDATQRGPVPNCTGKVAIGTSPNVTTAAIHGRFYFFAYYDSVLTQADLEDIFDETKHPACDFDPILYIDFHQAVAATYTTEIGAYVFDVYGSPIRGP